MSIIPDLIVVNMRVSKGVIAGRTFNPGNQILEFTGDVYSGENLPRPYVDDRFMQVGVNLYLGAFGGPKKIDEYVNHSCEPNAGVVFRSSGVVELVAISAIRPMEEITWDYSTTMMDDEWVMDCQCKKPSCRKQIGNYEDLPEPVRRRYEYLGIVAPYLAPQTVIR